MGGIEGIVALVIGIAVVLFVPALVWATVIAGLTQIVREKVRESRPRQERPPLPTRVGW
jgi:Na+-transporting methylmalonyl-CoA/oxaloacetate decarboxylase gamma subunit